MPEERRWSVARLARLRFGAQQPWWASLESWSDFISAESLFIAVIIANEAAGGSFKGAVQTLWRGIKSSRRVNSSLRLLPEKSSAVKLSRFLSFLHSGELNHSVKDLLENFNTSLEICRNVTCFNPGRRQQQQGHFYLTTSPNPKLHPEIWN